MLGQLMREQRFLESDWEYCVVLDACRYDVFSELYDEYFDGALEKRWSTGSATPEWAFRTFTGDHDIAYFSSNPFINSIDIPLNALNWGASCDYEWTATGHLSEVIDVWKHGWDDDLGTVPPKSVTRSVCNHWNLVDRTERTVIHYMQPHAPYLSCSDGQKLSRIRKGIQRQERANHEGTDNGVLSSVNDMVRPRLESALERSELAMKVGLWLELDHQSLWSNGIRETAMAYYKDNLQIVLKEVVDLLDELNGNVVITADHGEAFGEQGVWEHHIETHIPALMEVPWLEVDR